MGRKRDHPRLAEISLSRIQFSPGDRVIVNVFERLSNSDLKRFERTVQRWAGDHVEVLVVDNTLAEVHVEREHKRNQLLIPGQ